MRDIELSRRGRILILVPVFLLVLGFLLQEPFAVLMSAGLFSLFFYAQYMLKRANISVENEITEGAKTVGEQFTLVQRLNSPVPALLQLELDTGDEFEVRRGDEIQEEIRSQTTLKKRLIPKKRGYHQVGKLEGHLMDPTKLFRRDVISGEDIEVVVRSSKEAIKKAQRYAKRSHHEYMARDIRRYTSISGELEELREYRPGDRLKDIHWKSLSKFQKYMTKVYEKESMVGAHVLLDCQPSMRRASSREKNKLEHGVYLSLELLKNFELSGHDIGLTAFDHKNIILHNSPGHRRATFQKMYEGLTDLPHKVSSEGYHGERYVSGERGREGKKDKNTEESGFEEKVSSFISTGGSKRLSGIFSAVQKVGGRTADRELVILISDLENDPDAFLKAVERLKKRGHLVWIIVPFSGWYEIDETDEENLEHLYRDYEELEELLTKMKKAGASVFEVKPGEEGFKLLERGGEERG